jgi:hypothetical protein
VAPGAVGVLGISLGAIVGTVLAAVEPRVAAACLCMAGADLGGLMIESAENRVEHWVAERCHRDGVTPEVLASQLRKGLASDPARLGAHVDPDRVFLFTATLDAVIPRRNSDLLWECLGRPQRLMIPVGHYTAAAVFEKVLDDAARFLAARLGSR